ncbi:MAG TPA: DUF2891 family protein, partial [Actinomycetota bacterium]|nr:DUF2891 family protein [Actinomycetota bacterium]
MPHARLPSNAKRRGLAAAVALFAGLTLLPAHPAVSQESETDLIWAQFQADRTSLYNKLAPPFVDCFKRRDSAIDPLSPIFHGCIDWHSAVHAAYSHHALYRHTGAYAYLDLVEQQIAPHGVSLIPAEYYYEQAKAPNFPLTENPYGFGWFLILARERELATGRRDFREMADFAADQLVSWFQTRATNNDARSFILNTAHPNYSWSLINLDVWARYTNDPELLKAVRDASAPLFSTELDRSCPAARDAGTRPGFMPACLMRLAAVAHIWGDHVRDWVVARL